MKKIPAFDDGCIWSTWTWKVAWYRQQCTGQRRTWMHARGDAAAEAPPSPTGRVDSPGRPTPGGSSLCQRWPASCLHWPCPCPHQHCLTSMARLLARLRSAASPCTVLILKPRQSCPCGLKGLQGGLKRAVQSGDSLYHGSKDTADTQDPCPSPHATTLCSSMPNTDTRSSSPPAAIHCPSWLHVQLKGLP